MGEKDDDYPPDEGRLADGWRAAQPGDPAGKATDEIRARQIIMIIINATGLSASLLFLLLLARWVVWSEIQSISQSINQ